MTSSTGQVDDILDNNKIPLTVSRVVASDARSPWFESSHRQTIISDIYLFTVIWYKLYDIKNIAEELTAWAVLKRRK